MSKIKFTVMALSLAVVSSQLTGCNIIRHWWQYFDGTVETSLREPTGNYEHAEVTDIPDQLVIPPGLAQPPYDRTMELPMLSYTNTGEVGENIDVRAPVVPLRSSLGVDAQWSTGEAIVWLRQGGAHGIADEKQAWQLLGKVLRRLNIEVGQVTPGAFELTTLAADFNEFGVPYTPANRASHALCYHQIYRIRVGRSQNGDLGIASSVIGSMTQLSNGKMLENVLTPIELERFAMGFSNSIIKEIDDTVNSQSGDLSAVTVAISVDNNNQECFTVNAPYDVTMRVLQQMLPNYGFIIDEFSISHGSFNVTLEEDDPDFFRDLGVDPFNLAAESYIIRLGVNGDDTVITFYDEDDKPLSATALAGLYSGFSQALTREFALNSAN